MEFIEIISIVAVLAVAAVAVAMAMVSRKSSGTNQLHAQNQTQVMAELMGQITALSATQTQATAQLSRTMEERLEAVSKRLGDGLNLHTEKTGDAMKQVHERLAVIDTAQKNLTELSSQVVDLQDILSNKQRRGAFGEVQLENLVTDALPKTIFEFQANLSNGTRPDCLLKLPNPPGSIVIDSKFPLEAYRELISALDDDASKIAGRKFAADVKKHIVAIGEKYIIPGETAESALMFLPSEAIYAELHANFPGVVEESQRRRVYIVSPSTLMALLSTVRAVLKDVRMREQAGVIQIEVLKLLNDVRLLDERTEKLENHFQQADKDIQKIRTSTGKIIRTGEKIEGIQLGEEDPADELNPPAGAIPGRTANEP